MAERDAPMEALAESAEADTNALAVAVALGRSARSNAANEAAAAFLNKQSRLLDLQIAKLAEDRALLHRHLGLKYFGDRLRIGLQLLAVAMGLVIITGVGVMVWQASQDRGLVIEALDTPPDIAARGLTGKVLAIELQDRVSQMQARTITDEAATRVTNGWAGDIKVEIPQTGVSIGDASRYLHQWLGHQIRVTGELVHTLQSDGRSGLALTVRAGEAPGARSQGADGDLDDLLQKAAETIYGRIQPLRYVTWLDEHGREAETAAILMPLAASGPPRQRAEALLDIAQRASGEFAPNALDLLRSAAQLDPNSLAVQNALGNYYRNLGHDEAARVTYLAAIRAIDRTPGLSPQGRTLDLAYARSNAHATQGDFAAAVDDDRAIIDLTASDASAPANALVHGQILARDHDVSRARQFLAAARRPVAGGVPFSRQVLQLYALFGAFSVDEDLDDWDGALRDAASADDLAETTHDMSGLGGLRAIKAHALARLGRMAEADALIATTPLDCDRCTRVRGQIAALKGDQPAADRWFARVAARSASIPFAETDWGEALLAKGDIDRAIARFIIAHRESPHFADPLELWGEALMRQGDAAGAAEKFAEASRYAPRWGRDHLRWGEALAKLGRIDEARAQWRAAAAMGLSAPDRAALGRKLRG